MPKIVLNGLKRTNLLIASYCDEYNAQALLVETINLGDQTRYLKVRF